MYVTTMGGRHPGATTGLDGRVLTSHALMWVFQI